MVSISRTNADSVLSEVVAYDPPNSKFTYSITFLCVLKQCFRSRNQVISVGQQYDPGLKINFLIFSGRSPSFFFSTSHSSLSSLMKSNENTVAYRCELLNIKAPGAVIRQPPDDVIAWVELSKLSFFIQFNSNMNSESRDAWTYGRYGCSLSLLPLHRFRHCRVGGHRRQYFNFFHHHKT